MYLSSLQSFTYIGIVLIILFFTMRYIQPTICYDTCSFTIISCTYIKVYPDYTCAVEQWQSLKNIVYAVYVRYR